MSSLCNNLRGQKIFFQYKHLLARVWYYKTKENIHLDVNANDGQTLCKNEYKATVTNLPLGRF